MFLNMLMLVASMLPALHAMEHFSFDSQSFHGQAEGNDHLASNSLDCELCDFQFSSSNEPGLFEYSIVSSEAPTEITLSTQENISPLFLSYFSLRAPPAA